MSCKDIEPIEQQDPFVEVAHTVRNDYLAIYKILRDMERTLGRDLGVISARLNESMELLQTRITEGRKTIRFLDPAGTFRVRIDGMGSGRFGAARVGAGGQYEHRGVDTVVTVGDSVRAPMSGHIQRTGICYEGNWDLALIVLANQKWESKILYVEPLSGIVERSVQQGEIIGHAQDVTSFKDYRERGMKPHIHTELRYNGELLNPELLMGLRWPDIAGECKA